MKFDNLIYNASAHFAAQIKYPDGFMAALLKNDAEGFDVICWALSEMSTQYELVRRDMGYDKGTIRTPEWYKHNLSFRDVINAKEAILNAITKGIQTEEEQGEVDEVLQELQKKTEIS